MATVIALAATAAPAAASASSSQAPASQALGNQARSNQARSNQARSSQGPGPGVRVVGSIGVDPSHVGVIVSVPGAGGPLNARAFRLWENGRPKNVRVDPLPGSALRVSVVVDARPGDQLQGAQNAVADLMIGLPDGAEAAVVGARPARLIQPLTGDAGSVVRALAAASFSGPSDDAPALALALRQVRTRPAGRRAVILITTSPVPAALVNALPGQLRAADASLYVAAVPDVDPSLAKLAGDSGGWAVTASSARSLMPAVDAAGADLAHQYRLTYTTTYPALTATRLRVAVAGAGTAATAEATVRVPASYDRSAAAAPASAGGRGGVSAAWLVAAVLLAGLAAVASADRRRRRRAPSPS